MIIICSQYYSFLWYFSSNKCSLCEHKRLLVFGFVFIIFSSFLPVFPLLVCLCSRWLSYAGVPCYVISVCMLALGSFIFFFVSSVVVYINLFLCFLLWLLKSAIKVCHYCILVCIIHVTLQTNLTDQLKISMFLIQLLYIKLLFFFEFCLLNLV